MDNIQMPGRRRSPTMTGCMYLRGGVVAYEEEEIDLRKLYKYESLFIYM